MPPKTRKAPRRQATRRPQKTKVPTWVWVFTGGVLGAFIMFIIHLTTLKNAEPRQAIKKPPNTSPTQTPPSPQTSNKPRFDFYERLKETRVEVPNTHSENGLTIDTPQHEFIIQVASFRKKDDAEATRVKLILLNLEVDIEKAKVDKGKVWYRVVVGPFSSRSRLAKVRSTLISNHFEALVLKRPLSPP